MSAALTLSASALAAAPAYPPAERGQTVDTIAGQPVPDPYRWLENDVRTDSKVKAWVDAENAVTSQYLASLPQRDAIKARLKQLFDYERYSPPRKEGGRYFFTRNSGLQNQSVLYVQDALNGSPRVLIDPNGWSKDGATALAEWRPSKDGKRLAYTIQDGGTDWRTVKVLDVDSGRTLGDELKWVKFSGIAWAKDGSGFYYSRFPEPPADKIYQSTNLNGAIYFHRLGSPQGEDRMIYSTPAKPTWNHGAEITDDGRWLVITTSEGTDDRFEVTTLDLAKPGAAPQTLFKGLDDSWNLVGSRGGTLYFVTNRDAPRYRLVSVEPGKGTALTELVPQRAGVLETANLIGGRLVTVYLEDAKNVVRSYDVSGRGERELKLPGIGAVAGFGGEDGDPETFFAFTSFNYPTTIFRYDAGSNSSSVFKAPKVGFDPKQYQVEQQFYRSKDGTRVPMFVVRKAGVKTPAPTLLYGYGGFNISLTPGFSASRLAWLEMGGVYAQANLRGGGEYGKSWHDAGKLLNKQNVFDDFIAAGEHLVKSGVTTPKQLAVQGGSNGGLLIGAVVNQRPDLFAAALPAVGVMDMLRYNQFTAGRYWTDDYGDPNDPKYFSYLRGYSPYHNIKGGREYPAILVTTADTDDRVVPGHSFKYTAALQAAQAGDKPHLIRIETRAGHGSGKPTEKIIEETADLWAFAGYWTGLTRFPAGGTAKAGGE
jgi:prolyl oligopeptidase